MGLRLVPKSVTLIDLERRNDRYLAFFGEFGNFRGQFRQSGRSLRRKCSTKNIVFSDIIYGDIRRGC